MNEQDKEALLYETPKTLSNNEIISRIKKLQKKDKYQLAFDTTTD